MVEQDIGVCAELARLCAAVAQRGVQWTQGPGGNVSLKRALPQNPERLWIKASGFRLDAVADNAGIACLPLEPLVKDLKTASDSRDEEGYSRAIATHSESTATGTKLRASMEAGLHAVLPKPYVFHFHSLTGVLLADLYRRDPARADAAIASLARGFRVAFIAFTLPGLELMNRACEAASHDVLVLENHGVVLQCSDPQALENWAEAEMRLCRELGWNFEVDSNEGHVRAIALKTYFPDSAIFGARLAAIAEYTGDGYVMRRDSWSTDRDAAELWLAHLLLYRNNPALPEIATLEARAVTQLPTEKARLEVCKNDRSS